MASEGVVRRVLRLKEADGGHEDELFLVIFVFSS